MLLKVNETGVQYAKKLISGGQVDTNSHWNKETQPTSQNADQFIAKNGWKEYGKWFLAINPAVKEDEKQHYEFPYGDFHKVYREGVIAAEKRAGQYKHVDVENAAKGLLQLIK